MRKNWKRWKKWCVGIAASLLVISTAIVSYAYFTTHPRVYTSDGVTFAGIGMQISLLFDRLTVPDATQLPIIQSQTKDADGNVTETVYYTFDSTAKWGSAENPYIISDVRHLQNLSVLQNYGYFQEMYPALSGGVSVGEAVANIKTSIPYFLVCQPDGTPVTIDGTGITIAPVGNEEHPFIGYVGGDFAAADVTTTVAGKQSAVSAIHNVTVRATDTENAHADMPDIGLFGSIGYLGTEPAEEGGSFAGVSATVRELLISDVQIKVENPTWQEVVAGHRFTFTGLTAEVDTVPHENHHIGIFAGHVEYANIEYISVYYSSDSIVSMDLSHTNPGTTTAADGTTSEVAANYYSASGIIGFMHCMNPETNANGEIIKDSGSSNSDVSTGGAGGGGLTSGLKRGYVTASGMYDKYGTVFQRIKTDTSGTRENAKGPVVWEWYATKEDVTADYGVMITRLPDGTYCYQNATKGEYSVTYDGTTGAAVTLTDSAGTAYPWTTYIIQTASDPDGDGKYSYTYTDHSGNVLSEENGSRFHEMKMNIYEATAVEDGTPLCTEWLRERIFGFIGLAPEPTGLYYFYDGVFTFALSSKEDVIEDTWENNTADELVIGDDNDAAWQADTAFTSQAVAAYLKPVTSNAQLDEAIAGNKKLFIMYDLTNTSDDGSGTKDDVFLMTLYNMSSAAGSGNPDEKFSTNGQALIIDSELSDNLKDSYETGYIQELPRGMEGYTVDELLSNWDDYTILNVGAASNDIGIDVLEQQYQIQARNDGVTYFYYDEVTGGDKTTVTPNADNQVEEYYEWKGYFRYDITSTGIFQKTITYYFIDQDGGSTEVYSDRNYFAQPEKFFTADKEAGYKYNDSSDGEMQYTYTDANGKTYKGIVLTNDNKFYTSKTAAYPNNGTVTKSAGNPRNYIYRTADGTYYYANGTSGAIQITDTSTIQNTGVSDLGITIWSCQVNGDTYENCIRLNQYVTYGLSNPVTNRFLNIVKLSYRGLGIVDKGTYYSIWCGDETEVTNADNFVHNFDYNVSPTVVSSDTGIIVFDSTGQCYIRYNQDSANRFVNYNNGTFNGSTTYSFAEDSTTRMRIYTVEGTQTIDGADRNKIVPSSENTSVSKFQADEYVLWPNEVASGGNTIQESSYSLVKVEDLGNKADGTKDRWNNSYGEQISYIDLHRKFTLAQGMKFGVSMNLFGGTWNPTDSAGLRAPVGTTGEETNIPLGGVAFRINKSGESKIRVIVSVPTSKYYQDEKTETGENISDFDYGDNYYFGVWKLEEAGAQFLQVFRQDEVLYKFKLPASYPYKPAVNVTTDGKPITVTYDADADGTAEEYRAYLNGDRVLVAYEFTVSEEGIYVLGATNGPMEIVYFAADGTASAGRDGISGSRLGSIDFVYDYKDNVVVVADSSGEGNADGTEDYSKYYASLCLMYTDNTATGADTSFVNVNHLRFNVRRYIGTDTGQEKSHLDVKIDSQTQADYLKCIRYAVDSDMTVTNKVTWQ